MKISIIVVVAILAYVNADGYGHGYGDNRHIYHSQNGKSYKFGYDISSPYHHNYNSRHEEGTGGKYVKGRYSLKEKDGSVRVVEYVADHDGVKAVVKDKYGVTYHGYNGGHDGYGSHDGYHNQYDNGYHNGYY